MRLTVATYNIYLGADLSLLFQATSVDDLGRRVGLALEQLRRTDFAQRAVAIADLLHRERVDVVGLQEVCRWVSAPLDRAGEPDQVLADFLAALSSVLESRGTPYDVHAVDVSFEGALPVADRWMQVTGTNAVLVRRDGPVVVTGERTGRFASVLEVRTGTAGVTFPVRRSWGLVELELAGRPLVVANTHTEAYDAAVRDAQRDELLDVLATQRCPVVLLGDLNAGPGVVGVPAPYVDAWLATGGDPAGGWTCGQAGDLSNPVSLLRERIDYVFARDLRVVSCRVAGADAADRTVGGLWPSDHAAVVAELGF